MKLLSWGINIDWSYQIIISYFNFWSPYYLGINNILWDRVFPEFIDSFMMENIFDVLLENIKEKEGETKYELLS